MEKVIIQQKTVIILSKDNVKFEFRQQIIELCEILKEIDQNEAIPVQIDSSILKFIQQFCEDHDYDMKKVVIKVPLISDKLQDHLDPKTYELFKQYYGQENKEKFKPIVDAAYYLNFRQLLDVCLVVLGCPFYLGLTETEQEQFKQKWDMPELTPEEEMKIVQENPVLFNKLYEQFNQIVENTEKKYQEQLKVDQEKKIVIPPENNNQPVQLQQHQVQAILQRIQQLQQQNQQEFEQFLQDQQEPEQVIHLQNQHQALQPNQEHQVEEQKQIQKDEKK